MLVKKHTDSAAPHLQRSHLHRSGPEIMHPEKHLPELMAEKNSLDPSFVHAVRLLAEGKSEQEVCPFSPSHLHLLEMSICSLLLLIFGGARFTRARWHQCTTFLSSQCATASAKVLSFSALRPHSQQLRGKQLLLLSHSVKDIHGFENG